MPNTNYRKVTAVASATVTATTAYSLGGIAEEYQEATLYLNVTEASGTSPTLDVTYQVSPDAGTTWLDHTAFTQATGATTEIKKLSANIGGYVRFNCVVGGSSPSFTFEIYWEGKRL